MLVVDDDEMVKSATFEVVLENIWRFDCFDNYSRINWSSFDPSQIISSIFS